ncbi:MAG: nucleotidyltransferase family protein [Ignavibacteriae bacterium]|nr:nucleotidyltransferase family protein [Ignavibacteriota bacterium]
MQTTELLQSLDIPLAEIERICKKYYVKKLSLFGSILQGDARPDSDLDVLVEFIPGHVPGFAFARLERELSAIFERQVDLRTPFDLSQYFREEVLKEAQTLYAANGE